MFWRRPTRNDAARLDDEPLRLPSRPVVSVVVPALNEERHIGPLLDSLAAQDYGADGIEVIVADGGSADRTRELVRDHRGPFARLVLVDNPRRGTAAGLNAGMRVARGDCWIILGAHSDVRRDFVRASVEALRRTCAAGVGGPIETVGRGAVGKAIAAAMSSPFGVGDAKFRYAEREQDVDTIAFGCYHRRVWEIVGEFDDAVPAGDDDQYNVRVREAGGRLVLTPAIRSVYYARESFGGLARQYWRYGTAKSRLMRRGMPLRPRHFVPSAMVAGGPSLLVAALKSKVARALLGTLGVAYVVTGFRAAWSASRKTGANPVLAFAAMATMHATYGAGFLWGLWQER